MKHTILIAEDSPASRDLLSIILRSWNLEVGTAQDGKEAVEKVKQGSYDLILMDLHMPVMGGIEAAQIIRKELPRALPILALTAEVSEEDKAACLAAGMNDYLVKPVEINQLKEKIFYWLKPVS